MSDRRVTCLFCALITSFLLLIILIPVSFSYVEYYEYGLDQQKTSGHVNTNYVYPRGRYMLGPDHRFIKYQADAHYHSLVELSVFSATGTNESIGLEFQLDIYFTYLLIEDEIGEVHRESQANYKSTIVSRAKDAIKNEAIFVTFKQYFQARKEVEERFRQAVKKRWEAPPSVHCELDQFHLGRVRIAESVAAKQLQTRVQIERNDKESFLQKAQVEREKTAVNVNAINLERLKILRKAEAEASLLVAKAKAESLRIMAQSEINGTRLLLQSSDITTQDHKSAFTYIRTLRNRKDLDFDVSYLSAENVLRTQTVA